MTEEEAKEKWCPMAAAIPMVNKSSQRCIASECMAWVWERDLKPGTLDSGEDIIEERTSNIYGHCGFVK